MKVTCGIASAVMVCQMLRGEIRLIDFGAAVGSEVNKRRPAVIVSNDGANTSAALGGRGAITVVPVTSNTGRVYPFQVLLEPSRSGLPVQAKAQAEQIRSVDVKRVGPKLGNVPPDVMRRMDAAVRLHLGL